MTTYNTGNPVGSTDVRDLYDNAQNLDNLVNGPLTSYADRLGAPRKSWRGLEQDFAAFLAASGFELPALEYVDGTPLVVDRPTQLVFRTGFPDTLYGVKATEPFPATLSGTWSTDEGRLVVRSDGDLRQDLANATDPAKGAGLVGYAGGTVADALGLVLEQDTALFGAVVLLTAQPFALSPSKTAEENRAALQAACDAHPNGAIFLLPAGDFAVAPTITVGSHQKFVGPGRFVKTISAGDVPLFAVDNTNGVSFSGLGFGYSGTASGQYIRGDSVTRLLVERCQFGPAAPCISIGGSTPGASSDIKVQGNTWVGSGSGSFCSLSYTRDFWIDDNALANGSEGVDLNNVVERGYVRRNVISGISQNHIDVNSSHDVTIEDNTLIDAGVASRMVLISDYTTSMSFPGGLDEKFKHSNNIVFRRNKLRTSGYAGDFMFISNHGSTFSPVFQQTITVEGNTFENADNNVAPMLVQIGVAPSVMNAKISSNTYINVRATYRGLHNSECSGDTFIKLGAEFVGVPLAIFNLRGTNVNSIRTRNYAPPVSNVALSCLLHISDASNSTVAFCTFDFTTTGYALIGCSNGGTNRYIYNRSNTATTASDGVRENPGDVVV